MQKAFEIAFIGGGVNSAIGEVHKAASQMDGRFKLVAGAFSTHVDVNKQTAEVWGVAPDRVYADYKELLVAEKGKLDAVVVLAPTDYHEEIVVAALRAGFAVICEKSLATSVAEGNAIADAVAETKQFFCTTYNYTGYPMVRELKQWIEDGKLGKIQQVQVEMPQEGFLRLGSNGAPPKPQAWRLKDTVIPKISLDLGSHLHNMVYFLTGERPTRIIADEATYGLFPQIVDNVGALVRYTNDVRAQIWFSKTALGNRNGLRIRVYGSEGSAEWFQLEPETLKVCDLQGRVSLSDRTGDVKIANLPRYNRFKAGHPAGFIEAFANYYRDIADCLEQFRATGSFTSKYVCGIKTSLEGLAMMEAAAISAKSQKWEDI
ncbi:Gfo/Idh/MocA family protein [Fibrobacter sp. UWEL]|uniref:Gfo/Idh/MocA family protein n=1 Tax=Fibrobacter sp. UWEL TaxID=1896209 RepID=UPI00091859E2|nr:Gfo/Idh/MocA family oxidoreductase [Fibrobacter sp. UWEL]SHL50462.1 Predicted dehydrogenase [Fibrobacter sp. UWEL]